MYSFKVESTVQLEVYKTKQSLIFSPLMMSTQPPLLPPPLGESGASPFRCFRFRTDSRTSWREPNLAIQYLARNFDSFGPPLTFHISLFRPSVRHHAFRHLNTVIQQLCLLSFLHFYLFFSREYFTWIGELLLLLLLLLFFSCF